MNGLASRRFTNARSAPPPGPGDVGVSRPTMRMMLAVESMVFPWTDSSRNGRCIYNDTHRLNIVDFASHCAVSCIGSPRINVPIPRHIGIPRSQSVYISYEAARCKFIFISTNTGSMHAISGAYIIASGLCRRTASQDSLTATR